MTSIEVRDLRVQLPGGFELGPLSLDVASGARVAILGQSGCGKTTLLRSLAGLQTPNGGTIRLGGTVVSEDGRTAVAPSARGVGFVFQDAALWPHLTAREHLRFVDPALTKEAAVALLEHVGLAHCADRKPATFSGGEAQRLALARALVGDPRVLLLDEPLSSVDVPLRDELSALILRISVDRGLTTVLVTHDRREALAIADEVVVMRAGHIVESGSTGRLLSAPRTAYGAALVSGATCLPAPRGSNGTVETLFGTLPSPDTAGGVELVLLPGDVGIGATETGPVGRVLRVVPSTGGSDATVDLEGHVLHVACDTDVKSGDTVTLNLRGAPRILPIEQTP